MCKLCEDVVEFVAKVAVAVAAVAVAVFLLVFLGAVLVKTVAQILVDSFCATINKSIDLPFILPLLKGIADSLSLCSS